MIAGLQLDDALLEQQRQAYAVQGVDESEPAQQPKKRKQAYTNGEEVSITPKLTESAYRKYHYRSMVAGQQLQRKPRETRSPESEKTPLSM